MGEDLQPQMTFFDFHFFFSKTTRLISFIKVSMDCILFAKNHRK